MGSADFPETDMSGSVDNDADFADAPAGGLVDFAWVVVRASESGFYLVFWGSL